MTGTLVDLVLTPGFAMETPRGRTAGAGLVSSAREHATHFERYPTGSGVLIAIEDPAAALAVAVGAWWAGLRVAFARTDSPYSWSRQAAVIDAAVVVGEQDYRDRTGVAAPWRSRATATDDALDVITSGTTGAPKVVVSTHAAIVANASALAAAMTVETTDRLWTSLHHGLPGALCTVTLAAAAGGATAVLSAPGNPAAAARDIGRVAPTVVYAVPEVYDALGRDGMPEVTGVRWWLSSSARLPRPTFDRMLTRWGAVVRSFYCGSEAGTITFNAAADVEAVRDGVGSPLPGVTVELTPDGRIVVGGELCGRGYRRDGAVAPFPAGGILTGDLGALTDDGVLYLIGRQDDRIHVGADVVDPQVVEAHVAALPGVDDCLVVGRPHSRLGHVLEARVVRTRDAELSERDVILGCRQRGLRGAWVPRGVAWIDAVPRTPAGKPDRSRPA